MTDLVPLAGNDQALEALLGLEGAGACTPVALRLDGVELSWDAFVGIGAFLGSVKRRTSWWLGDWILEGERRYGEAVAQAVEATGLSPHTLVNYRWVASRIPPGRRVAELPFALHDAVAALEPGEQTEWLGRAAKEGWTREILRKQLRDAGVGKTSRPALGEAHEAAESVLAASVRDVLAAGRRMRRGWWVPEDVWAALEAAA